MEKLASYIAEHEKSQTAFAMRIGIVPQKLSLILSRQQRLLAVEAVMIEDATQGKVTVRDLV
jgi:DNA-binding transcriptional regulator YdaS (Cro superfamily)